MHMYDYFKPYSSKSLGQDLLQCGFSLVRLGVQRTYPHEPTFEWQFCSTSSTGLLLKLASLHSGATYV